MNTMKCILLERVIFLHHSRANPSQDGWDNYLAVYEKNAIQLTGVFVVTEGGVPSAAQRKQLADTIRKTRKIPVAILTRSPVARAAITTFHWLGMTHMVVFSPAQSDAAFLHIQADTPTRLRLLSEMEHIVAQPPPA